MSLRDDLLAVLAKNGSVSEGSVADTVFSVLARHGYEQAVPRAGAAPKVDSVNLETHEIRETHEINVTKAGHPPSPLTLPLFSVSGSDLRSDHRSGPSKLDLVGKETATVVPALLVFPCAGRPPSWELRQEFLTELTGSFPSLDVLGECRKALTWVKLVAGHRKTAKGMARFLFNWMGRVQDRGAPRAAPAGAAPAKRPTKYWSPPPEPPREPWPGELDEEPEWMKGGSR